MKARDILRISTRQLIAVVALAAMTLLLSSSASQAGETVNKRAIILPHVEANEDFFTGLSFLNTGDETSGVNLVAFNENGLVIGEKDGITLLSGQRYITSITDAFGHEVARQVSWVKVEYTGGLTGFGLIGNDGQLARIPLQVDGKKALILPYVISGDGPFTQIYILNVGAGLASITLSAYDGDGGTLKKVSLELPIAPGQKVTGSARDFFGPEVSRETSWIKVESNERLMGLALIGTTNRLFSVTME